LKAGAAAIFVAGVGFVGLLSAGGAQYGLVELVVLTFIVALAVLGIRMIFRSRAVEPAVCPNCGGVVSPNAPYCKHCKAPL
jgi:hypothetical protein